MTAAHDDPPRGLEMEALAGRLDREASELEALPSGQDEFLAGAERCAALPRIAQAARLDADMPVSLALAAAQGFRAAVSDETAAKFPERIAALDRRL